MEMQGVSDVQNKQNNLYAWYILTVLSYDNINNNIIITTVESMNET